MYRYKTDAQREKKSCNGLKWKKIKEEQKQPTAVEPSFHPTVKGSRFIEEFEYLNKIDEGSCSVVYRAHKSQQMK
ncbi:unnamed protein product [Spodoptera littoralis]|uniref:Uncharacterized protein n=1 Tax=Spodoptera littoralis TaxID=7109 RepID=A0A9P0I3T1_SPOLI|nr:unnamed protein product [Spodoptera littoralis]CAH1640578.1 unnamed protein product [Spodoptera littoralis]